MTIISYAQNFEDIMLSRALAGVDRGFYIDIGAHHPTDGSVTKALYDAGWSGINVEPTPAAFQILNSARSRDINLNICVGAYEGQIDIFDVSPSGLATTDHDIAMNYIDNGYTVEKRTVAIQTLVSLYQEYQIDQVHFLKIDVEGAEEAVLSGADFEQLRPWIVVVEATLPNSQTPSFAKWEHLLLEANYLFAYFDGLNRFYVAKEHSELLRHFKVPPNFFDGFALAQSNYFVRHLNESLNENCEKIQALENQVYQLTGTLEAAHTQIEDMSSSKSWQVTYPLRAAQQHLMLAAERARTTSQRGRSFLQRSPYSVVLFTLNVPGVHRALEKTPGLKSKILRYVQSQPALSMHGNRFPELFPTDSYTAATTDNSSTKFGEDFARLTPSARRLFQELDTRTARQHESTQP